MGIKQNARVTAHGFHPFHPVGVGTHRQGQTFDFHMHQLAGFGDFIGIVGFVPFAQNAFGAPGHEEAQSLDHLLLQFHVRRNCAPVGNASRDLRLDEAEERHHAPLRSPADVGTVPPQPFFPPVQIGIAAARTCRSLGRRGVFGFCFEKGQGYHL